MNCVISKLSSRSGCDQRTCVPLWLCNPCLPLKAEPDEEALMPQLLSSPSEVQPPSHRLGDNS